MDSNTVTIYGVAGGLSVALCLVLWAFAHFQPGTKLIPCWITAITLMSTGLVVAGFGPMLPRWIVVILANILMLSSGPIIYSGFSAFANDRPARVDWLGWGLVAAAVPGFWYWGLVEPNGSYRSVLFSMAIAATHGRTAVTLLRRALRGDCGSAIWLIGSFFAILALWMAGRSGYLLLADQPPPELRGVNPTTWMTVFWYMLLVSCMSICAMWFEVPSSRPSLDGAPARGGLWVFLKPFHNKLLLLASAVIVEIVMTIGTLGIAYNGFYSAEKANMERLSQISNEAATIYSRQLLDLIDTILLSVRNFLAETKSVEKTERYISGLKLAYPVDADTH